MRIFGGLVSVSVYQYQAALDSCQKTSILPKHDFCLGIKFPAFVLGPIDYTLDVQEVLVSNSESECHNKRPQNNSFVLKPFIHEVFLLFWRFPSPSHSLFFFLNKINIKKDLMWICAKSDCSARIESTK